MDEEATKLSRAEALHREAEAALSACHYDRAETLYRQAMEFVTSVLDPLHTSYVDMLKGLRTSLSHQNKPDEVAKVDFMIAQLCVGQ
jgi:hypothetical protein